MMWQMQSKFPRHRYHPVPGITCALQQVSAHGPQHAGKAPRLPGQRHAGDHLAPEFDRAREVLQRSLLN